MVNLSTIFCQWLVCLLIAVYGQQTVLISDFPPLSSLGPCASKQLQDLVSGVSSYCANSLVATSLASCACLKNQNGYSVSISSAISSSISFWCASTDTADITTAISVFSAYCAAAKSIPSLTLSQPLSTIPLLTDYPLFSSVAPCARSQLAGLVNGLSSNCASFLFPTPQASCACLKNQFSNSITSGLPGSISFWCGPTNTDDLTTDLALFSAYCALVFEQLGTTPTAATAPATGSASTTASPGGTPTTGSPAGPTSSVPAGSTPPSNSGSSGSSGGGHLDAGAIAGIVVGVVGIAVAVFFGILQYLATKGRNPPAQVMSQHQPGQGHP